MNGYDVEIVENLVIRMLINTHEFYFKTVSDNSNC